jgi:hypothetical protein
MPEQTNGSRTPKPDDTVTAQEVVQLVGNMLQDGFDQYLNQPTTVQMALLNIQPIVLDATIPDAKGVPAAHKIIKCIDSRSGINVDLVLPLEKANKLADDLKKPKIDTFSAMPVGMEPPKG